MPAGRRLDVPRDVDELAAYVVSGAVEVDSVRFGGGVMLVVEPGQALVLDAVEDSRVMIIGGEPLGERHIWWNFVSSSRDRIEQAKDDWKEGRFDAVPGDDEFIPLPEK